MKNLEIISVIDEQQADIFNARLQEFSDKFASLAVSLQAISRSIPGKHNQNFKQILLALLHAYESRDYLLVADTLEFELKPLLTKALGGER